MGLQLPDGAQSQKADLDIHSGSEFSPSTRLVERLTTGEFGSTNTNDTTGDQHPPSFATFDDDNSGKVMFNEEGNYNFGPSAKNEDKGNNLFRSLTSALFGIPFGFFHSHGSRREWGEEVLVDPSVQPVLAGTVPPKESPNESLPGYNPRKLECFNKCIVEKPQSPGCLIESTHNHFESPGSIIYPKYDTGPGYMQTFPGYDYEANDPIEMYKFPYPRALMSPINPNSMYGPANPYVAYPYGVPAVEENEKIYNWDGLCNSILSKYTKKFREICGC